MEAEKKQTDWWEGGLSQVINHTGFQCRASLNHWLLEAEKMGEGLLALC